MDTGCWFDLIHAVTARLSPLAVGNVEPIDIRTASGATTFNKTFEFHDNPLN